MYTGQDIAHICALVLALFLLAFCALRALRAYLDYRKDVLFRRVDSAYRAAAMIAEAKRSVRRG